MIKPQTDQNTWIPEEAYLFFPSDEETRTAAGVRCIFDGNTKFNESELKHIDQFQAYAKKHNYPLKSMWTDNLILRFLYANGFKMDKTLSSIKEHTTWQDAKPEMVLSDALKEFLDKGYLYIHGRDSKFRPIIVFNAYIIDSKTLDVDLMIAALTYFFEFLIKNLLLPGQVENWIFITDLKGMSLTSIPFNAIKKLISYLQHNYRGRLAVMYIVNAPTSVYIPWQMAKKFMEESTAKKMQFSKKQIPEALLEHAHLEQLEVKYGGKVSDNTQYWPPKFPSNNYFVKPEDRKSMISKEEYALRYKSGELDQMIVNPALISGSKNGVSSEPTSTLASATSKTETVSISKGFPLYAPGEEQKLYDAKNGPAYFEEDDGDYLDQMDENHDIAAKVSNIHQFRASFLVKNGK